MTGFEVLPASCCLERLQADWDLLYRRSGREPSVSYEWSRAIIRNHLAGREDWFIVLLRRDAVIAGIVPMVTNKERLFGHPIVTLQPVQEKNNTHSDLLLADEGPDLIGAWLDALSRRDEKWDLLRMSRLLEHAALTQSLSHELARRGLKCRWRLQQPSFHLQLPASYPQYLSQRSGKFRNYLKRAEKKLATAGKVELRRVDAPERFAHHYEELLSIERDSWKHEHGTAISAVAHQGGFYRDLAEAALQSGMLHLTFLRVDGLAVAYNLGLVAGRCYFYLKTSYRQQYRAHGAASVGRARLVEQLIAEGCTTLDFPAEPYEWEKQWAQDVRWHRSLLLYSETLAARALWLVNAARDLLRRSDERRIVFYDPRDLRGQDSAP